MRDVLDLLMRLEKARPRTGGRAEILLGNHEVDEHPLRSSRCVAARVRGVCGWPLGGSAAPGYGEYPDVMKQRGATPMAESEWMSAHPAGFIEYTDAFAPGGRYGRWLRDRKVVVNEGGTIFMHAGIRPEARAASTR